MLGWFNLAAETSIEDIEWLLARAAGFDAGFALCVDTKSTTKNGQSDAIFEAIKQWESARLKGAFSIAQKLKLKDVDNEFHLETVNPGEWNLYPFQVKHFVHEQKVHQPGEPAFSIFDFENPYHSQPLIFTLRLLPGANSNSSLVKKIIMEVNNYSKIEIPVDLEPFQTLKSFGSSKLQVFDKNWKLLKVIDLTENIPFLSQGDNKIVFDAVFADQGSSSFKIEIKTLGEAETVKTDHKVK
jgi:hypothetical protein